MLHATLCLGVSPSFERTTEEQIVLFQAAGFDAFFTAWDQNLQAYRKTADRLGMIYQSVHAPFRNAANMWKKPSEAADSIQELLHCVKDCADIHVPIVVVHPYIGFDGALPTAYGTENFRKIVDAAREQNVRIAFENVEGEAHLQLLMQAFSEYDNVGFCWDAGHELCYNKGKDMLRLYGDRLIATHLNDNLGVSDAAGSIYWTDDLHLLPFDGIRNWAAAANRLNEVGYNGILTFELTRQSKPNRHDNDKYARMPIEEYIAECYARACRVAHLKTCQ